MTFGFTNAPAVFQGIMNDVLREFRGVFVSLDDILIFSLLLGLTSIPLSLKIKI